ncbi:tip elongation aberrant protein 1-like, partial [Anneissia japonica]|uniref:tip elongation aberrant protein 1-like n=1 Tax=Anneissia japonica TaxID=1529436 RepID=UPI0014258090
MIHSSDGNLLIFGGFSIEHGFLNDVWNFNTSSREWRKERSSQNLTPMPRSHHAASYLPSSNKMVIVGGQGSSQIFCDIWLFSVETKLWEKIM